LIDEFQDTNGLQQEMVNLLALDPRHRANLFIVGDPKQSIYGFRGADVHVFSTVSAQIDSSGGARIPLHANFRSRPQLIHFFNELFRKAFHDCGLSSEELDELGFVPHEESVAEREDGEKIAPLVELHVCEYPKKGTEFSDSDEAVPRELDAAQVAARINELVTAAGDADGATAGFRYKEIAVLFRAMTSVGIYESALRRAGIPYRTVAGSGFYQREEVGDLIQLLCFVDNLTDELALASVLRSPLCCVSDNALMALRCGPALSDGQDSGRGLDGVRPLYRALLDFESIELLDDDDRAALSDARSLISTLVEARHRLSVPDLLRLAVERASYLQVIAASFDGALRVANVEKLIGLAERFTASGPYTVRDFVRFVRDFEKRGGRESEGSLDETLDAVSLMTVHQSKGLEFPVVILPDLHRVMKSNNDRFVIDRHRGLSLCVPDGKGDWLLGSAFSRLKERAASRDRFESMRLLYVAATRAKEMLILSGATSEREKLVGAESSWLGWIYSLVVESPQSVEDSTYNINGVKVRFELRLPGSMNGAASAARANGFNQSDLEEQLTEPFESSFPLLKPLSDSGPARAETYSVTKLSQFEQCPRHYYFKYISGLADSYAEIDQLSDDLPFGPSALVKGWVLHRFCETYRADLKVEDCLRTSIDSILKEKQYDPELLAQRIDHELLFRVLKRFAVTYSKSAVFARIEEAGKRFAGESGLSSRASYGVFSERRFTLRHRNALVMGTIDKMIVTPHESGEGSKIEIIDFKTNRIPKVVADPHDDGRSSTNGDIQFQTAIASIADMYRLQMQAYAFAVRSVLPGATGVNATLHFLDGDVEYAIEAGYLTGEASKAAVDAVLGRMDGSRKLEDFAPRAGEHCRRCGFLKLCAAGSRALTGSADGSTWN
jgi:ATP-dependent helicase/nuclease subunit A